MDSLHMIIRKPIVITLVVIGTWIILFYHYHDIPMQYYREYTSDVPLVVVNTQNGEPQTGFFKFQPEWDFKVPTIAKGWDGYARVPRNRDVVVLTASDGGGHNSAIKDILERVIDDRKHYCEKHGYTHLWLNTSRYDVGDAHRTWSKIPAVAEAFYLHPAAEWVWLIDTDIILMNPEYDLVEQILCPDAIRRNVMRDTPILDGQLKDKPTHIRTPKDPRIENMDILITQDHASVNTGSVFFRRSAFTRWILEMMTDYTMLMGLEHSGAEQDALKHLMLEHQLVRDHVAIFPQRKFNAFVQGGDKMGWRDGDLLVHLAGCWVNKHCGEWFEQFWSRRGQLWKPEKDPPQGA
ncbi:glycosyltransferase family 34 protein [Aaosphaeria arxii CBS 175.79]|uniref:Glycosyltransferase family 34 protein n=1 Tax=Aaosphaeria arxii CBS 175.79 TaxID=1450172 RepID=A0A6A5Y502_9PLEO|nr:glycosyltransferase family 34 protein [Aaosphaeria arxii CBS 175.79]KAF2020349.1 glycosyltransferase family 34 protein [Aaosphaeria arxii CBS 175.79]